MTNGNHASGRSELRDDPRLTAYALGELAPEERAELERALAADPALAEEVRGITWLASELSTALGSSPPPVLDDARREAMLAAASHPAASERPGRIRWGRLTVAASLIALAGAGLLTAITRTVFEGSLRGHGYIGPGAGYAEPSFLKAVGELFSGSGRRAGRTPQPVNGGSLRPLGYGADDTSEPPLAPGQCTFSGGSEGVVAMRYGDHIGGGPSLREILEGGAPGTESYDPLTESPFRDPAREPLSTFSIDVDTASYANVRRFLTERRLPPPDAVRIEELVNYFRYDYPEPRGDVPFSVVVDAASAPWNPEHRLVRIGLCGRAPADGAPKVKNLVFLVDVSGSMNDPAKLPLVQRSLRLLVDALSPEDRVALVVYAGASGVVLPSTSVDDRARILDAIERLSAGGSTHGSAGIQLAYSLARERFVPGGVNRVVLATDGDFNVGITDRDELLELIEREARSGVFLSVLGFGTGNLKDSTMEQLADHGNGNYAYVDSLAEARKVLVREMGATLETIAKDVKIQVELNPARVAAWRLVGYENRVLAARDFADDEKDAGEIGAGHTVTALYEIVPAGGGRAASAATLRYQPGVPRDVALEASTDASDELLTVSLRYKEPDGDVSRLLTVPFTDDGRSFEAAAPDLRFAAAVAAFGLCLRGSETRGAATLADVYRWAEPALGPDPHGDRREFLRLVDLASGLSGR